MKRFFIKPVESREASLEPASTLDLACEEPDPVPTVSGFISFSDEELDRLMNDMGLAMNREDLALIQDYFRDEEQRDPTITEIRVLDT